MLMAKRYPTCIRSIGVGWALTVGRIGSIISPSVVGIPLAMGWTAFQILTLPILPSLLGAVCIAFARQGPIDRPEDAPAISLPLA
jgi:AAHS family 4-hydroxybenzoate transporter-like MFS transporter